MAGKKIVFDNIAQDYDFINSLSSLCLDNYWRRFAVKRCNLKSGDKALDVACGTGKITLLLAKRVENKGRVVGVDISPKMISVGKDELRRKPEIKNVKFSIHSATNLPFKANLFDAAITGFGIRNIAEPDRAISEMARVVEKGGKVVVLELVRPKNRFFEGLHHFYTFHIIPFFGEVFAGRRYEYAYLAESISRFNPEEKILKPMEKSGLVDIEEYRLTFGSVVVFVGTKK